MRDDIIELHSHVRKLDTVNDKSDIEIADLSAIILKLENKQAEDTITLTSDLIEAASKFANQLSQTLQAVSDTTNQLKAKTKNLENEMGKLFSELKTDLRLVDGIVSEGKKQKTKMIAQISVLEARVKNLAVIDGLDVHVLSTMMQDIQGMQAEYNNTIQKALAEADAKFASEMTSELSYMKRRLDNALAVATKKIDQLNSKHMDRVRFVDDRLLRESAHGDRLAAKFKTLESRVQQLASKCGGAGQTGTRPMMNASFWSMFWSLSLQDI